METRPITKLNNFMYALTDVERALRAFEDDCGAGSTGYDVEATLLRSVIAGFRSKIADLTDDENLTDALVPDAGIGFSVSYANDDPDTVDGFFTLAEVHDMLYTAIDEARTTPMRTSRWITLWAEQDPCSDTTHPDYDADYCGDTPNDRVMGFIP